MVKEVMCSLKLPKTRSKREIENYLISNHEIGGRFSRWQGKVAIRVKPVTEFRVYVYWLTLSPRDIYRKLCQVPLRGRGVRNTEKNIIFPNLIRKCNKRPKFKVIKGCPGTKISSHNNKSQFPHKYYSNKHIKRKTKQIKIGYSVRPY